MYQFELKPARRSQVWDKEIEKIFDVFSQTEQSFVPACEIIDEEKFYSISLDVPGLRIEDIEIEVRDNRLHISGDRPRPAQTTTLRAEKKYGKFSRIFSLPTNVSADAIEAKFEAGVLDVLIPKEEKSHSKKIQISGWKKNTDPSDLKN